eukprot:scaffold14553_cov120-Isochrysis_galbana.AAC.1
MSHCRVQVGQADEERVVLQGVEARRNAELQPLDGVISHVRSYGKDCRHQPPHLVRIEGGADQQLDYFLSQHRDSRRVGHAWTVAGQLH